MRLLQAIKTIDVALVMIKNKMNFNILFTLLSTLSFELYFDVSPRQKQDFFLFDGENSTAHLFRENQTLVLYLKQGGNYAIYKYPHIDEGFSFSWVDFKVNDEVMKLHESVGDITNMSFDGYTLISPVIIPREICKTSTEHVYKISQTNYIYILLIVLGGGILMKTDIVSIRLYRMLITLFESTGDADYVEMDNIRTQ